MQLLSTQRCRALLIVLLLGFTALTLHASLHAQPDTQSCTLCAAHFKPSHAVAPAAQAPLPLPSAQFEAIPVEQARFSAVFISYRQRAPPI